MPTVTYRRLMDHLAPGELLGLTATPEQRDGLSCVRSSSRARLPSFACVVPSAQTCCARFTTSPWPTARTCETSAGVAVAMTRLSYQTSSPATERGRPSCSAQLRDKVLDPGRMRALGFCVSVAHAEFMADVFNEAGVPARAVSGATPAHAREEALADLKARRVNVLFAADLFNEGLDLPDVDTVHFLRPTESATVFLQQLGRGLRRTASKAVLTVLDFVGHHRKEFRFDHQASGLDRLHATRSRAGDPA